MVIDGGGLPPEEKKTTPTPKPAPKKKPKPSPYKYEIYDPKMVKQVVKQLQEREETPYGTAEIEGRLVSGLDIILAGAERSKFSWSKWTPPEGIKYRKIRKPTPPRTSQPPTILPLPTALPVPTTYPLISRYGPEGPVFTEQPKYFPIISKYGAHGPEFIYVPSGKPKEYFTQKLIEPSKAEKRFWKEIGYSEYIGKYEPFTIPKFYEVSEIKETPEGLEISFQPEQRLWGLQAKLRKIQLGLTSIQARLGYAVTGEEFAKRIGATYKPWGIKLDIPKDTYITGAELTKEGFQFAYMPKKEYEALPLWARQGKGWKELTISGQLYTAAGKQIEKTTPTEKGLPLIGEHLRILDLPGTIVAPFEALAGGVISLVIGQPSPLAQTQTVSGATASTLYTALPLQQLPFLGPVFEQIGVGEGRLTTEYFEEAGKLRSSYLFGTVIGDVILSVVLGKALSVAWKGAKWAGSKTKAALIKRLFPESYYYQKYVGAAQPVSTTADPFKVLTKTPQGWRYKALDIGWQTGKKTIWAPTQWAKPKGYTPTPKPWTPPEPLKDLTQYVGRGSTLISQQVTKTVTAKPTTAYPKLALLFTPTTIKTEAKEQYIQLQDLFEQKALVLGEPSLVKWKGKQYPSIYEVEASLFRKEQKQYPEEKTLALGEYPTTKELERVFPMVTRQKQYDKQLQKQLGKLRLKSHVREGQLQIGVSKQALRSQAIQAQRLKQAQQLRQVQIQRRIQVQIPTYPRELRLELRGVELKRREGLLFGGWYRKKHPIAPPSQLLRLTLGERPTKSLTGLTKGMKDIGALVLGKKRKRRKKKWLV